ncbi:hypothetical protein HED49_00410 [Ochrobactrum daejeonense]|nr:hypothetical protein [Brucella daejeonensis]
MAGGAETPHIAAPPPSRGNAAQNGEHQGVVLPWWLVRSCHYCVGKGEY